MADPILPGSIRAQVAFQGLSGLPEDQYVNSFVFNRVGSGEPTEALYGLIADALRDFYAQPHFGGSALQGFMAAHSVDQVPINFYWLGQAPPRTPTTLLRTIATSGSGGVALPSEVALCASFYSVLNVPRNRGRIYLGPLSVNAVGSAAPNVARPATTLINSLAQSAKWLAQQGGTDFSWAVLSKADGVAKGITDGWVDNAFDTQRRRGEEATSRQVWSNVPA